MESRFMFLCMLVGVVSAADPNYLIGVGVADVTGPAADVNMWGYAHPGQRTAGIHFRLYSRAFITCEFNNTDVCNVFVSVDIATGATAVNLKVFEWLKAEFGDRYTEKNVVISGTHTHSGPGGYLQYLTYTFTTLGFVNASHDCIVAGVVESIRSADSSLTPGNVFINQGELRDSSFNRSPTAYLNNPEAERARYNGDTDTTMTVAKFVDEYDNDLGLISWFPVHPVSMNSTNRLISGDNKGYAAYLTERYFNGNLHSFPGVSGWVAAAFPNSNHGDVSPNTNGPRCLDTGEVCDVETSTCNGRSQLCVASGPGRDMFESTEIIGENQYLKAVELYNSSTDMLLGPVGSVHQFVDMSDYDVITDEGTTVKTCTPALGYSFAAGTVDGAGFFTFKQGTTEGSVFWDLIRDFLKEPSEEMLQCHLPKPVLLPTGEVFWPWQWHPTIVDTQMIRIGQLAIIAVPGEFTTMSGRRLRETVQEVLLNNGMPSDTHVVITGLSNTYTHYITTPEEYAIQRYEGASTIYGPNTLPAYLQQYSMLAESLAQGNEDIPPGPAPPNLLDQQRGILLPIFPETFPIGIRIGDIFIDVDPKYRRGSVVMATFWAGNPRNDPEAMLGETFAAVEYELVPGTWTTLYDDHDWSTRFYWEMEELGSDRSQKATVYWDIPLDTPLGNYRLRHDGYFTRVVNPNFYSGTSRQFVVVSESYIRA